MMSTDPPDHTRLRKLVNKAFTPRMIANFEATTRDIVDARMKEAAAKGEFDYVQDICFPVPSMVIATLLGVDPGMWVQFQTWGNFIVEAGNVKISGTMPYPEWEADMRQAIVDYRAYCLGLMAERRDKETDDLISALVHAADEGDRLSEMEVLSIVTTLLLAGAETTRKMLSSMLLAFLRHPDQLEMVRQDHSLISNAVEECVRWDGPATFLPRKLVRDYDIGGTTVPKDAICFISFASADRDEKLFPDRPEEFDITRDTLGHVGFGRGAHFCLGAALARQEGQIVLEDIVTRFKDIEWDPDRVVRTKSFYIRGLENFPIRPVLA
jgi:cytochrome P450